MQEHREPAITVDPKAAETENQMFLNSAVILVVFLKRDPIGIIMEVGSIQFLQVPTSELKEDKFPIEVIIIASTSKGLKLPGMM